MTVLQKDTIAAIATPPGTGGVAIVRISGEKAEMICRALFHPLPENISFRYFYFGKVVFNSILLDKALCVLFEKGASFTGETVCEFHCHGGQIVAGQILAAAISLGARPALNGEFTKRAFLNGMLDLSEAEAVCDLINAESQAAAHSAVLALDGELSRRIVKYQETLRDLLASIDATIDYPDEIDEPATRDTIKIEIKSLLNSLKDLTDTFLTGRILRDGLHICIAGLPNAGKSSLLNALSGRDRAIVTSIAGTTRDILHEIIDIHTLAVHLYDTAGLRTSADEIEQLGVSRAYTQAEKADAILYLIDSSVGFTTFDEEQINILQQANKNIVLVLNKVDLSQPNILLPEAFKDLPVLSISTVTGEGIAQLKDKLYQLGGIKETGQSLCLTNERHFNALTEAHNSLKAAFTALDELPLDCVSVDLFDAYQHIGELTGETVSEDIIDRIFEKFCVGK